MLAVGEQDNVEIILGSVGHHAFLNAGGKIGDHVGDGNFQGLGRRQIFRVAFAILTRIANGAGMPEHLKTPASQGEQFHVMLGGELVDQTIGSAEQLAFQPLPARRAIKAFQGRLGCVIHLRQGGLVGGHEMLERFLPTGQHRAQRGDERLLRDSHLFGIQFLQRRGDFISEQLHLIRSPSGELQLLQVINRLHDNRLTLADIFGHIPLGAGLELGEE